MKKILRKVVQKVVREVIESNAVWFVDPATLVGNWDAIDQYGYVDNVEATFTGGKLYIYGLGVDMMENYWGEPVIASNPVPVIFDFTKLGAISINDQYYFTTFYDGNPYDYNIIGTGIVDLSGASPVITITYDIKYVIGGYSLGDDQGGWFVATLTRTSLELTFDAIANAPVANPATVAQWNTWFGLPTNGTPFTSVKVVGNTVQLKGGAGITLKDYLFGDDACGEHLIKIIDNGCVVVINEGVFSDFNIGAGCHNLTTAQFPSVITLGYAAFADCEALVNVTFTLVETIGAFAFNYCPLSSDFQLPLGVTSIGEWAFMESQITTINISSKITTIGDAAFYSCAFLPAISVDTYNPNYCDIDGVLFNKLQTEIIQYPAGKADISYTIPSGVTVLKKQVFGGSSLVNIVLPSGITSIEEGAFHTCISLESLIIPSGVTSIIGYTFFDCNSLTSITIPASVMSIGDSALRNCDSLPSVTIPVGVVSIGASAFRGCSSLVSVNMYPTTAPTVANVNAFGDYAATLHIVVGSTGYNVAPWTTAAKFASIVQDL
jgi:hypothetical protein